MIYEEIRCSVGRSPPLSWNIRFVRLNLNLSLPPISETQDDAGIHDFYQCTAALGIKHTPCFSNSLQLNIKVPYSTMKLMADHSDKHHNEVSADELSHKWGIGL